MVHQTPATTSWNGGELSPLMVGRVDTSIYQIAAERMENFVPCIEGPLQKCPGFERIRKAADTASWMMRFVFNLTQSYALECSDQRIRFYTNGGRIETGATSPYEVVVPYRAAEWSRVSTPLAFISSMKSASVRPPPATDSASISRTGRMMRCGAPRPETSRQHGGGSPRARISTAISNTSIAPDEKP